MSILDILANGGVGTAVGAVVGVGQKWLTQHMEIKKNRVDYAHVEKMQGLQHEQELRLAENELYRDEVKADTEILTGGYLHDSSFKNTSAWVDNIRGLTRPLALFVLIILTFIKPDIFVGMASMALSWWFSSRVRLPLKQ